MQSSADGKRYVFSSFLKYSVFLIGMERSFHQQETVNENILESDFVKDSWSSKFQDSFPNLMGLLLKNLAGCSTQFNSLIRAETSAKWSEIHGAKGSSG